MKEKPKAQKGRELKDMIAEQRKRVERLLGPKPTGYSPGYWSEPSHFNFWDIRGDTRV